MPENFLPNLEARFLRYVQIDTQSDEDSLTIPSTAKQLDLLRLLADELRALGVTDVTLTEAGYVLATIPATVSANNSPILSFFAHVDTAPAFNGTDVKPIIYRRYDGAPIHFPDNSDLVLSPKEFPYLKSKQGDDIITASGTTLLGADDKAGVAILMTLAAELLARPDVPHGEIRLCFNPDEEVGRGMDHLKLEELGADIGYTLDGGPLGEMCYETFSADKAVVKITGVSTHPGEAKDKMVNALHLAGKVAEAIPENLRPETTAGRQGFIHLYQMRGMAAEAELVFILRDFELEGLAAHGALLRSICNHIRSAEHRAKIECTITEQYRNMRYWLEKDMRPVDLALAAMRQLDIAPLIRPIRGGTDGSHLTARGLPCPNLFTGMQNYHGPLEWVSLQDMGRAVEVCLCLAQLWATEV